MSQPRSIDDLRHRSLINRMHAVGIACLVLISASMIVLLPAVWASPLHNTENLIENPGFEAGSGDTVDVWGFYGDITWTDQEVYSGERAMRIAAEDSSSSIQSSWFQAPPHSRVEIGAWLKAQDVISNGFHFKLRVTLNAFAEDQATRILHWDLITLDGTFDWTHFQTSIIVPPDVAYFRLSIQLTESSGTFWVDDVTVHVVQILPAVEAINIGAPVILPQPWQMQATGATVPVGRVGIAGIESDRRLGQQLISLFNQMEIDFAFVSEGDPLDQYNTVIRIGDGAHAEIDGYFANLFPAIAWGALGDQGYFLSVAQQQQQSVIYIGGNTETAQFYGLQTLKRLLDPATRSIAVVDIADRPSLSRRGAPIGIQWFDEQEELLNRMASLKLNFAWNQGSFLNEKFWFRWREPLTTQERAHIAQYVEQANQLFIVPHIAIAPRGPDAASATTYSSDTEIDLVVEKMATLYELGVRNFGLSFDDLVNFQQDVLYGPDVEFFDNDIGAAHVYFTQQVYDRLTVNHPNIHLMVVPMKYDALSRRGGTDEAYFRQWTQLPAEIGIYSVVEQTEGASAAIELTQRPHMVWDNFWSSFYQRTAAPETVIPLERPTEFREELITGYSFAPLIPILEDEYLISWRTAADYAWAPERYAANPSFQFAAAQHLNSSVAGDSELAGSRPEIFPDSGIYTPPLTVTLSIANPDSGEQENTAIDPDSLDIHYTTDGSVPTPDSPRYTGPLALANGDSVRVRSRIFDDRVAIGGLSTAFFQVSPQGTTPPAPAPVSPPEETLDSEDRFTIGTVAVGILLAIIVLLVVGLSFYWRNRVRNRGG